MCYESATDVFVDSIYLNSFTWNMLMCSESLYPCDFSISALKLSAFNAGQIPPC